MNKKIGIIPIVIIVGFAVIGAVDQSDEDSNVIFHVTLADPELYNNGVNDGVYTNAIIMDKGEYYFRFVPNGSSPDTLSIKLAGAKII